MNILGQLEQGAQQLQVANSVKLALFSALTEREQVNISRKVMGNINLLPSMFVTWVGTEEGTAAVRALVDKFTGDTVAP